MEIRSIKFQISVLYVLILGVILIAYRIFIHVDLSNKLYRNIDRRMMLAGNELGQRISELGSTSGGRSSAVLALPDDSLVGPDCYRLFSAQGEFIGQSKHCINYVFALSQEELKRLQGRGYFFKNIAVSGKHFRLANLFFSSPDVKGYIVQVWRQTDDVVLLLRRRIYTSATSILLILLTAHLLARLLVKRILAPMFKIAQVAQMISIKDLSARVSILKLDTEMMFLANAFNQMLASIERSFEYIKEFTSNISHELKTPLAIIKGETEVVLRKERQAGEYRRALSVNLQEANRMIRTTEDLILLTKFDYAPEKIQKEPFDFIEFFTEIQQRTQMLASHKQINLSVTTPEIPMTVQGNKLHLSRLFMNIIHNAIKFTPTGGNITMVIHPEGKVIKVSISDTGPGISQDDLPMIFNRFFHKDVSKSESSEGAGLGLSIAKSIAQFHKGQIEVRSKLGEGSTFTVSLPMIHS